MSLYEEITIKNQQKGEQIGQEKKTIEFVLKLHDFGNPIESIAEYTSISVAKVNEILEKHNRI